MALKTTTKSIPLSGGITQAAPEELSNPPAMAYMENARFRKTDQASKTLPLAVLPPGDYPGIGVFNAAGTPVLWSDDEQIACLGRNEVSKYIGDGESGTRAWRENAYYGDGLGLRRLASTEGAQGGSDYTWAPIWEYDHTTTPETRILVGFIQAFMRISYGTSSEGVFQIYDEYGNLHEETVVPSITGVKCTATCYLSNFFYSNSSGEVYKMSITGVYGTPSPLATWAKILGPSGATITGYTSPNLDPRFTEDTVTAGEPVWDNSVVNGRVKYEDFRPGLTANGTQTSLSHFKIFQQAYEEYRGDAENGNMAWLEGWTSEAIYVTELDPYGVPTGTKRTLTTGNTGPTARIQLFDCAMDDVWHFVLWAKVDTTSTSGDSDLMLSKIGRFSGTVTNYTLRSAYGGHFVNGSLDAFHNNNRFVTTNDGEVAWAATYVKGSVDSSMESFDYTRVDHGVIDAALSTEWLTGYIYGARLVSDLIVDKYDNPTFAIQQWERWCPMRGSADPTLATTIPAKLKPVTTQVVRLDADYAGAFAAPDTTPRLIATIDAGQSKAVPAPRDECSTHLNNMYYSYNYREPHDTDPWDTVYTTSHEIMIGNRVMLSADDVLQVLKAPLNNVTDYDGNRAMTVGEGMHNIYRLSNEKVTVDHVSFDNGFLINTAVPMWYDGGNMVPATIPDAPEISGISPVSPGIDEFIAYDDLPNPDPNSLFVQCITGFYDQNGVVHRSAPGKPVYVGGLKGEYGSALEKIQVYAIGVQASVSPSAKYFMEYYIGEVGEDAQLAAMEYYTPGTRSGPTEIDCLAHISGGSTQVPIPRNTKFVYTTGDVLASDPWPSMRAMYASSRRVFAISEQAPGTVYYSKIFEENVAPEFSASLTTVIGADVELTAIGGVDDKVFVFTKNEVYVMYGTGPDNTGADGDFFVEKVNIPYGCTDNQSVVTTPDGVAFYSSTAKRFLLITRDMQIVEIGEAVQDMTDFDGLFKFYVKAALHVPTEQEIRWYTSDPYTTDQYEFGEPAKVDASYPARPPRSRESRRLPTDPCMVYNYHYKKWTILSGQEGHRACMWKGHPVFIEDGNVVFQASDTAEYRIEAAQIWETPWIKVNQLQDFGRFRSATILGKYLSTFTDSVAGECRAGDLQVEVLYDYEENTTSPESHLFRANQELNQYDVANTDGGRLQMKVQLHRQKCQSIKFRITEVGTEAIEVFEPTYTYGRGFELTGLDLTYGLKRGSGDKNLNHWSKA